jgi:Leucine-rich repeat (LRR) protein
MNFLSAGILTAAFFTLQNAAVASPSLLEIRTAADLNSFTASTKDDNLKKAILAHASALQAAIDRHPHVEAVRKTVGEASGKLEQINTTPEPLRQIAGGDLPVFDSLSLVDLAVPNAGPHDARKNDPYDETFFKHLGQVSSLESLNIIATKFNDAWMPHVSGLVNLRTLRFTNNGKLTDKGLEQLASLVQLEAFSFVGTHMQGHAYANFHGFTKLKRVSHRGSAIDDEGLKELCSHLPNLESLSLAHAKFTDAGAVHFGKLKNLKSLEIGSRNATPACLAFLKTLPLESLQLGDGLDASAGIAELAALKNLKKVSITNGAPVGEADLQTLAGLKNLETLEFDKLNLTEDRVPALAAFAHLKTLILALRPAGYPENIQSMVRATLPKVEVKFVR